MATEVLVASIGAATTVLVALGGWVFAWMLNRDTKETARLKDRVRALEQEVLARIDHEQASVDWVAEMADLTPNQAKMQLRDRCEGIAGRRPKFSPSKLDLDDSWRGETS